VGIVALATSGVLLLGVGRFAEWLGTRVRAPGLFLFLEDHPRTRPLARAATVLSPLFLLSGVVALPLWGARTAVLGGFLHCGLLLLSVVIEAVSRSLLRRQAAAIFTLYLEGVLAPDDAAAIDHARARDPRFDAAVRDHQHVVAMVKDRAQ
jgi:hypothetical protein